MKQQLASGHEPVVVFIHQALDHLQGIENQDEVRGDLEAARMVDGAPRVLAVFSGHHHQDWARTLNGIHYIQVNSASCQWVGEAHARESYAPAVHRDHPWIRMTCPYRDPLWARVRLDLRRRVLEIEGRATAWVGLDPWARGVSREAMSPETTRPAIADRTLRWRA